MHSHYPLALAAPLGCLLALFGLMAVATAVRRDQSKGALIARCHLRY
jgi:hypothetical protein